MELYYAIMNILDYLALNNVSNQEYTKMFDILNYLSTCGDEYSIADIADANNCGNCTTWDEVINELRKQFSNHERG